MSLTDYRRSAVTEQVGVVRFNEAGQAAKYAAEGLAEAAKLSSQLVADAETRYLLEFEHAQRRRAADIAKNYPVDSEGFKAAHSESARADLAAVPWYFRERARAVQDKLQTDHYATIVNNTMVTERANARSTYSARLDAINKELAAVSASGERSKQADVDTSFDNHVKLGLLQKYFDEGTASIMRRQYDERKKRLNTTRDLSRKRSLGSVNKPADAKRVSTEYSSISDISDDKEGNRLAAAFERARVIQFQGIVRRHIERIVTDGIPPNFVELSATLDELRGPSAEKLNEQARWLEKNGENLVRFARLSPAAQSALLDVRRNAASENPNDFEAHFAQAVHASTRRSFFADEFAAGLSYLGGNRPDFDALRLGDPDFGEQVAARFSSAARISKLVGKQIAPAFTSEVRQIAERMELARPPEKMHLVGQIYEAFGDYAVPFWRRLASSNQAQYDPGTARIARVALLGSVNRSLAARIFQGQAAVHQYQNLLPDNLAAMRYWVSQNIGSAIKSPTAKRALIGDILYLYALEARDFGIRSGKHDPDILASAYDRRVGEPIDCNGISVIPPVIGWTGDDLRKYLATLDAEKLGIDAADSGKLNLPVVTATKHPVSVAELCRNMQLLDCGDGLYQLALNGENLVDPHSGRPMLFDFYRAACRDGAVI